MTKVCDNYEHSEDHIQEILSQIVKTDSTRGFKRLVEWLLRRGARFPKCQLKNIAPGCRATFARQPIHEDEEIMFIPRDYIITSNLSMSSDICTEIKHSGVEIRSKHTYLASFLLQERDRKRESKWFPYIDILPKTFSNIPLFFDRDQLEGLKGSLALQKIQDRHDSLRAEYQNLRRHVASFSKWSYEDFVWARLVVITRIFGLLINNQKTDGLVPMADMINHRRPRETRWTFNEVKQGFVISAMQDFRIGDQIYDSYGRKCNSRFFVNYGFALENNPDNECSLKIALPSDARRNTYTIEYTDFQVPKMVDDKKSRAMFSMLRWSILQEQNKNQFLPTYHNIPKPPKFDSRRNQSKKTKGQYVPPISVSNELAVLRLISKAAEETLSRFPNSLEHDKQLLSDHITYPPYSNQRNVIIMRSGEKEVLHTWLEVTQAGTAALVERGSSQEHISGHQNKEVQNYYKSTSVLLGSDSFEPTL